MYAIVFLFLLPCVSASRVRLATVKDSDEGLFVPQIPGAAQTATGPAVGAAKGPWRRLQARLKAVDAPSGDSPEEPHAEQMWKSRLSLEKAWNLTPASSHPMYQAPMIGPLERLTGDQLHLEKSFAKNVFFPFQGQIRNDSEQWMNRLAALNPVIAEEPTDVDHEYTSDGVQVFTDFDDTLFSSGGGLSGIDESFYKHERYPGALQFMLELSRGPYESKYPSKVVPLLARPHTMHPVQSSESALREFSHVITDVKKVGDKNGIPLWGVDVDQARQGHVIETNHQHIKQWKRTFAQWKKGLANKPTVFVGDNGMKDLTAAEKMAMDPENDSLEVAFIHDVRRERRTKQTVISPKIHVFDTYYDAAQKALELELISEAGMRRVEQAFITASIVKMCQNQDKFTDGRYPCIDKEKGILVDAATFEPIQGLELDIDDGTAIFSECLSLVGKPGKPLEFNQTPLIVPAKDGSRCASITRVINSLNQDWEAYHNTIKIE